MRVSSSLAAVSTLLASSYAAKSSTAALLSSGKVDLGEYQAAYEKATAFVAQLTNAQKVSIITGSSIDSNSTANGSISWTPYANKDGFAGINQQYYVSSFPMGGALAMTWDKNHFEAEAKAAGKEFYDMGYNGE